MKSFLHYITAACMFVTLSKACEIHPDYIEWTPALAVDSGQGVHHECECFYAQNCPHVGVPPSDGLTWVSINCTEKPPPPRLGSCLTICDEDEVSDLWIEWYRGLEVDNGQGVRVGCECYIAQRCPSAFVPPSQGVFWQLAQCRSTPPQPALGSCDRNCNEQDYDPGYVRWEGGNAYQNGQGVHHACKCYTAQNCPPADSPPVHGYYWYEQYCHVATSNPIPGSCGDATSPPAVTTTRPAVTTTRPAVTTAPTQCSNEIHPNYQVWQAGVQVDNDQAVQYRCQCFIAKRCPDPNTPPQLGLNWYSSDCTRAPTPPLLGSCTGAVPSSTTTTQPTIVPTTPPLSVPTTPSQCANEIEPGYIVWQSGVQLDNDQGVQYNCKCFIAKRCPDPNTPPQLGLNWYSSDCTRAPSPPLLGSCGGATSPPAVTTTRPAVTTTPTQCSNEIHPNYQVWQAGVQVDNDQAVQYRCQCFIAKRCPDPNTPPQLGLNWYSSDCTRAPTPPLLGSCTDQTLTTAVPTTPPAVTSAPAHPDCPIEIKSCYIPWVPGETKVDNNQGVVWDCQCWVAMNCPTVHDTPYLHSPHWYWQRCTMNCKPPQTGSCP